MSEQPHSDDVSQVYGGSLGGGAGGGGKPGQGAGPPPVMAVPANTVVLTTGLVVVGQPGGPGVTK